ncbi:hypothetical protein [Bacillus sp. T3]|uniref:hypothetical protein n=1 Tax=Bacillus sp. T3 TaxID=467262 RepID=UPI00298162FC|nr:hypothetical protein [Bacillus sp. T3]
MSAEVNKNSDERNLLIPSVKETKKKELISLLASLIRNYVNNEIGKEGKEYEPTTA